MAPELVPVVERRFPRSLEEHRIFDDGKVSEAAGDAAAELLQLVEGTVGVIVPPKLRPAVDQVLAELGDPRVVALSPLLRLTS